MIKLLFIARRTVEEEAVKSSASPDNQRSGHTSNHHVLRYRVMPVHLFLKLDQPRGQLCRRKSQLHHLQLLHGEHLLLGHS